MSARRLGYAPVLDRKWGKANMRYRKLLLRLMAKPKVHVILTGQPRPIYDESGRRVGADEPRVQRQTEHMVDLVIHMEKQYDKVSGIYRYISTVTKCRWQRGLNLEIEDLTFDKLVETLETKLGVVIEL